MFSSQTLVKVIKKFQLTHKHKKGFADLILASLEIFIFINFFESCLIKFLKNRCTISLSFGRRLNISYISMVNIISHIHIHVIRYSLPVYYVIESSSFVALHPSPTFNDIYCHHFIIGSLLLHFFTSLYIHGC